jgi:hypothetical protein
MSDVQIDPPKQVQPVRRRFGIFHDPLGDVSSKRVQSFSAFLEAVFAPLWAPIIQDILQKHYGTQVQIPILGIMALLLSYSAALQGIAWGNESRMNSSGYQPPMNYNSIGAISTQSNTKLFDPKATTLEN